jgi:flagellar hook-basal body complex protein FliE
LDIQKLNVYKPVQTASSQAIDITKPTAKSFSNLLSEELDSVNQLQQDKAVLQEKFIAGELTDVHTLMIATEKAKLGLQLTVQVRNKVLEAYQEMMRMQV